MIVAFVLFLVLLLLAGGVLVWEARTGRFVAQSRVGEIGRAVLFFLAVVAGAALFVRTVGNSWLLGLALVPVTTLSLLRLVMLARQYGQGGLRMALLAAALFFGLSIGLAALPESIDERFFLERVLHQETGPLPQSIDPAAHRSVRT